MPAVPTRSSLRQVLNAAEDVVADDGGHLLLISVFKCPDKSIVLPSRFLVRPPGLRAVRERPPQQPHEEKKHRRTRAFVDPKVKLPVEFRQPDVIRQARRNLPVEGFDIRDVIVGDLGHRKASSQRLQGGQDPVVLFRLLRLSARDGGPRCTSVTTRRSDSSRRSASCTGV